MARRGFSWLRMMAPLLAIVSLAFVARLGAPSANENEAGSSTAFDAEAARGFINENCVTCHDGDINPLDLRGLDSANIASDRQQWERVNRQLRSRAMPPAQQVGKRAHPIAEADYESMVDWLESMLDRDAMQLAAGGPSVQRLTRSEYKNAIRDLFELELDIHDRLPADETGDGAFDNMADSLTLSRGHLSKYMSVARHISRSVCGLDAKPTKTTFEVPLHLEQDERMSEELPHGSRGGLSRDFYAPVSGTYRIALTLRRQYQDHFIGMGWPQTLDLSVDGRRLERFSVGGKAEGTPSPAGYAGAGGPFPSAEATWERYMIEDADSHLHTEVALEAGPHRVTAYFALERWEEDDLPQPVQRGRVLANDELYLGNAAIGTLEIRGPNEPGDASASPVWRRIFTCAPKQKSAEEPCARVILARLARRAYRRPVTDEHIDELVRFFRDGRASGGSFSHGVQLAIERMLIDPRFLLRVYSPVSSGTQDSAPLDDFELASRLSFFLWSSIPDDELLDLASKGRLRDPEVLVAQAERLLADPRGAANLVDNFAGQWLNLRRLDEVVIDPYAYPRFTPNLVRDFRSETERFLTDSIREERSVLDLLTAEHSFLNERLAEHYGIEGVYGERLRRIELGAQARLRGGLLTQGAQLTTTSYPHRTSPVLRGKWLLDNILGFPASPPPADVTANLDRVEGEEPTTIRDRLERHRSDRRCARCHALLDPLGFALERFDAIGGYRSVYPGRDSFDILGELPRVYPSDVPVDASATTPDGTAIDGAASLKAYLIRDPEQFPRTLTRKLLTFALGRPTNYRDEPSVRRIVRDAAAAGYRWRDLVLGIVRSEQFARAPIPVPANATDH